MNVQRSVSAASGGRVDSGVVSGTGGFGLVVAVADLNGVEEEVENQIGQLLADQTARWPQDLPLGQRA